jgi:hypothetical protein
MPEQHMPMSTHATNGESHEHLLQKTCAELAAQ